MPRDASCHHDSRAAGKFWSVAATLGKKRVVQAALTAQLYEPQNLGHVWPQTNRPAYFLSGQELKDARRQCQLQQALEERRRFEDLASHWRAATSHLSVASKIASNEHYQNIIGLGPA